jgi:tetratricopeptide (TPR) repeat protein
VVSTSTSGVGWASAACQATGVTDTGWQQEIAALWTRFDEYTEDEFLAAMERLVATRPADDPVALYEHGSAYDSIGREELAVAKYRRALAAGLPGQLHRQATIQLASSLRNLDRYEEAVELLTAELARDSDDLDDAIRAFLALALTSAGREREAVSVALTALAPHLTRYNRSLTAYAKALVEPETAD